MISRFWRGATRRRDADRYVEYLKDTGLADYTATPGNLGAEILRRDAGERTFFVTRSTWRSLEDVRHFAGADVDVARFYPEDDEFLIDREERVEHLEIAAARQPAAAVATLDHVVLPVSDLEGSIAFYSAALAPLDIVVNGRMDDGSAGFGRDGADDFWIFRGPAIGGAHVAFTALGHDQVDAFHAAATAAGGRDNGAPGLRPKYHGDYYAAFVRDLDGNNIEAVCHVPGRRRA